MNLNELKKYQRVQSIAKDTMNYLASFIESEASELDIANAANEYMSRRGVSSFWYYGLGSLVFAGERTTLSISGKDYEPSREIVEQDDLVTVDLSPEIDSCWGDFARSFVVENGKVITNVITNIKAEHSLKTTELLEGVNTEIKLHNLLQKIATHAMTFEELHFAINEAIEDFGYTNLDFKGNLGHSIEKDKDKRRYIENGCKTTLSDVDFFTFEPHIGKKGGLFGYKQEDIYYFSDGVLKQL